MQPKRIKYRTAGRCGAGKRLCSGGNIYEQICKNDKTKTNVMRLLDAAKIPYEAKEYPVDENDLSGSHAADMLGVDHGSVFKTLVLKGERTGFLVCCIPVDGEVDLKKAAKAAGDKKVEMLPMKDLLATTGYIRGGCSPIGMKKKFPTFIDEAALKYETIAVSAGQRGFQVLLSPQTLADYVGAKTAGFAAKWLT